MKLPILSLICALSLTALTANADVYSLNSSVLKFVKVIPHQEKPAVRFEFCERKENLEKKCRIIGSKNRYYPKFTLRMLRDAESLDVLTSLVSDVAIVAGGVYAGVSAGAAIGYATTTTSAPLFYFEAGMVTGAEGGVTLSTIIDSLNPYEQIKQLETLSDDVLSGKNVFVEMEIIDFVKRLEVVLANLDDGRWLTIKNGLFKTLPVIDIKIEK
jgi:hypothetical protein